MNEIHQHDEGWQTCPPGTIGHMTGELRLRRKTRTRRRVASGVGVALVAVAVGLGLSVFLQRPIEYHYGDIACSQVQPLLPQFLAGALDGTPIARNIEQHLAECPTCGPRARQMQAGSMARHIAESNGLNRAAVPLRANGSLGDEVPAILSLASSSAAVGQR